MKYLMEIQVRGENRETIKFSGIVEAECMMDAFDTDPFSDLPAFEELGEALKSGEVKDLELLAIVVRKAPSHD